MASNVVVDALIELILADQLFEVHSGVVGAEEEHSADHKFVITIVVLESFRSFGGVSGVDKVLPAGFVE